MKGFKEGFMERRHPVRSWGGPAGTRILMRVYFFIMRRLVKILLSLDPALFARRGACHQLQPTRVTVMPPALSAPVAAALTLVLLKVVVPVVPADTWTP